MYSDLYDELYTKVLSVSVQEDDPGIEREKLYG